MNIRLIRHGMTKPGEEGRYQGFLDESLSEKGRAALVEAASCPVRVYVSPAKRARETAAILFPSAEQICVPGLWEMNFGVFEGRTWKEMERDAQYREWVEGSCLGTCPDGESRASFSERVCDAFLSILAAENNLPDKDIYIVSHGGTQMAILERWGQPTRDYYSWQRPCGCGWLVTLETADTTETNDNIFYTKNEGSFFGINYGNGSGINYGNDSVIKTEPVDFHLQVLSEISYIK